MLLKVVKMVSKLEVVSKLKVVSKLEVVSKFSMQIFLMGILMSLSMSLFGCSKTKEIAAVVLKDRGEEYTCAKSYPPLQIPREIPKGSTTDAYCIPEGSTHGR